jgi:glycosyltransferase involved in cell wall biosynthesis
VTVLMSVYNGERFLREAMESILEQTFSDFEFLIIDDGSTDSTPDIVRSFSDARIKLVRNERNMGMAFSWNRGLAIAKGEYIARMDADDVSLPERLKKQVAFMDAYSDVGICGSWVETFGTQCVTPWHPPVEDGIIRGEHIFHSDMCHPSVIFRKALFEEKKLSFDANMFPAEDYDLWVKASKFMRLANIPERLLLYRVHGENVGNIFAKEQHQSAQLIRVKQIMELGIEPSKEEAEIHSKISLYKFEKSEIFVKQSEQWFLKLQRANHGRSLFPEPDFSKVLAAKWLKLCYATPNLGFWTFKTFWRSPLRRYIQLSWKTRTKFLIRCVLKYNPRKNLL